MSLPYFYNSCWMAACHREACAFRRDSNNVRRVQAEVLADIVRRNRSTWFGRNFGLASVHNVDHFQNAVPLSDYDDYRSAIERIADGELNVLTADRVRLLQPTSGSTSGEKLIPFTAPLARSFHRALRVWIWDLFSHRPDVRRGRGYWSISPLATAGRRTKAGIPIGFEHDAQYLGRLERCFARKTIIAPPQIVHSPTVAAAQYATLFFLLRARDLCLISVWSPTFLTELLTLLWANREQLVDDVATGRVSAGRDRNTSSQAQESYPLLPDRAAEMRSIFRSASDVSDCVRAVWPSLSLVSCWADGPSLAHANNLRQYLSGIPVQPKGLLATEAFISVPLESCDAPALAIRSHFFEFQAANTQAEVDDTRPLLADELVDGERYRVIVTTAGGLYRYRLHDEVEVAGFHREVPLLRFVGKTDDVSDIVGEKLHAAHVESVLQAAFRELALHPTFSQMVVQSSLSPGYVLKLVAPGLDDCALICNQLCRLVENGLEANPGYKYARATGQLQPLVVEMLDQREADIVTQGQVGERLLRGQRLGNIKPVTLRR
jgi:hypothetical protein